MVATQDQSAISIYEPEDPGAVINIVGVGPVKEGIEAIPQEVRDMCEEDFESHKKINDTVKALRIQFWQEFNRRQDRSSRKMILSNIFLGVCSSTVFFRKICTSPIKLAYILLPPRQYETDLRLLLELANKKRKEILEMDSYFTDRHGNKIPNDKLIGFQVKILEGLENRLFGTAIARSASVETQLKPDSPEGKQLIKEISHDEAKEEIKRLASKLESSGEVIIDAEVSD